MINKRKASDRTLQRLIETWTPIIGTVPRDAGDALAHLGLTILAALEQR
jgi:hypothetical protein